MKFRPCIDIHNGLVKQIVGGSLKDIGDAATENFVSNMDAAQYAELYKKMNLTGGHVIMLNPQTSEYYEQTKAQAVNALQAWPGALQIGGGINPSNASYFLDNGASHVIITSYVFKNGILNRDHLNELIDTVGSKHLVIDLSCRKKGDSYYVVTDRWQKFTEHKLTSELLLDLSSCCDEFLIHAADAEGKASGIEENAVELLTCLNGFPVTYAGGVGSLDDLDKLRSIGHDLIDVTVGSALDLFGGHLLFEDVLKRCQQFPDHLTIS